MYVIIGGSGYLGSYFIKNILENTEDDIIATYNSQFPEDIYPDSSDMRRQYRQRVDWRRLNISNLDAVESFCGSIGGGDAKIIYLSAYHHPDKVLENPKTAWHINIVALAHFMNCLPDDITSFYYSSTQVVYGDGTTSKPFTETDELKPINAYGESKKLAETLVLAKGHNVIRYPFLIGKSITYKKHFFDVIVETLQQGKEIDMFSDTCYSAIDFNQAASLTVQLMEKYRGENTGITNIAADGGFSKYDIALQIADKYGLDRTLIKEIGITDNNDIFVAKRSATVLISNDKIKRLLGLQKIDLEL